MKTHIYGIRKLNSKLFYYIGKTVEKPEQRVIRHYQDALAGKHHNKALSEFLIKEKFQVDLLATVLDEKWEYWFIQQYKMRQHPLLNNVFNYNFKIKHKTQRSNN